MTQIEPFAFATGRAEAIRPQKLSEQIARRIVGEIVDNGLASGTRLPVESELGARLGVGKNTLREALLLLETWGVVEIRQGRNGGPFVRSPRPDDVREALTIQLMFSAATLQDVFEARCCIEPRSAMLAAERMPDDAIAELRRSVAKMRERAVSQADFLEENQRFHKSIAAATGNVVIETFIDTLKAVFDGTSAGVSYKPARRLAVADAHEQIVDAIEARDSMRASTAMERHLREAGDFWHKKSQVPTDRVNWRI